MGDTALSDTFFFQKSLKIKRVPTQLKERKEERKRTPPLNQLASYSTNNLKSTQFALAGIPLAKRISSRYSNDTIL